MIAGQAEGLQQLLLAFYKPYLLGQPCNVSSAGYAGIVLLFRAWLVPLVFALYCKILQKIMNKKGINLSVIPKASGILLTKMIPNRSIGNDRKSGNDSR